MRKLRGVLLVLGLLLLAVPKAQALLILDNVPEKFRVELKKKFSYIATENPTPSQSDEILKYIMNKGTFDRAEINEAENNNMVLVVRFLKTIKSIKVEGEDEVDDIVILRNIAVSPGDRFETSLIPELQGKVKNIYADRGFHNVMVDVLAQMNADQTIALILKITENSPLRISKIQVSTSNSELQNKLVKLSNNYKEKILTASLLLEIQTNLTEYLRQNRYIRADVTAPSFSENKEKTKVIITFPVTKTEQYSVLFEGNYNFSSPTLREALELETFYSANPNVGSELSKRIKDYYLNRGFARVEVESEEQEFIDNETAKIKFQIKEGSRVRISGYELKGEFSQPEKNYIDFILENSSENVRMGIFKRDDIELSIKNLVIDLQNRGYLKAKVNSTRYQFDKSKEKVTVTIDLDEGPLTRIKELNIEGQKSFPLDDIISILNLNKGSSLRLIDLELGLKKLKEEYQARGFLEMKIINEKDPSLVEYNSDNTEAAIIIKLAEGPRIKANSIIIDGNSITKEYVIRKEIDFKEGEFLSPDKINESIRRLQKTGLFSSIEIRTLEENTNIANRTVIIKVSDRNPGLFNIGTGVTNERELTLRGFVGLAYRNLDGLAKALSGRIDINYNVPDIQYPEYKITFGYLEPYLWNTRVKGKINITRSVLVSDFEKRLGTDTQNATFSLEQNITSHFLATYDVWGINTIKDFPIDDKSTAEYNIQNIGTLGPGFELDYRDHPFAPTSGTLTRFNVEYSHPNIGSSRGIQYLRTTGSFTHYLQMGKSNWIWANQLRGGELKNQSPLEAGGVPYSKKGFTLGGLSTIRGFEAGTSERFPNDTDLGSDNFYLKTKADFALIKSEIRFPISGDFGGALFYDGGFVQIEGIEFQDNYRDSAGIGFRYSTPVGPVNLELAWKLDRKAERKESPYRFHFSIGSF